MQFGKGWPFNQKRIFCSPSKNHPDAVKSQAFEKIPHGFFYVFGRDIGHLAVKRC